MEASDELHLRFEIWRSAQPRLDEALRKVADVLTASQLQAVQITWTLVWSRAECSIMEDVARLGPEAAVRAWRRREAGFDTVAPAALFTRDSMQPPPKASRWRRFLAWLARLAR